MASPSTPANTHEDATNKCANYATPANRRCLQCIDGVDLIGTILQWAFYAGRKVTWHASTERVKMIEDTNEPKLVVWRDKNQDSAHFAPFPDATFNEERDMQAVLACAAPGVTIFTGLMQSLLEGTWAHIQVKEMAIRPKSRRCVRFVPRGSASLVDPSLGWIICATLRDGSKFAIDVCNAQYTVDTSGDAACGVFPWEQYMRRLSVTSGDLVSEQALGFCINARYSAGMTGTARDVQAGVLTPEDKQCVVEIIATATNLVSIMMLPTKHDGLTLAKLMRLPTFGYEKGMNSFKACHQRILDLSREKIDTGCAE